MLQLCISDLLQWPLFGYLGAEGASGIHLSVVFLQRDIPYVCWIALKAREPIVAGGCDQHLLLSKTTLPRLKRNILSFGLSIDIWVPSLFQLRSIIVFDIKLARIVLTSFLPVD